MDLVRGHGVNEALNTLRFVHRRAAPMIAKVIKSALANAGQDLDVDVNRLFVADARADDGPLLGGRYRWRPRAMGRVYPIRKRTSHLSIILAEGEEAAAPVIREEREPIVEQEPVETEAEVTDDEPVVETPVEDASSASDEATTDEPADDEEVKE